MLFYIMGGFINISRKDNYQVKIKYTPTKNIIDIDDILKQKINSSKKFINVQDSELSGGKIKKGGSHVIKVINM